MTTPSRETLAKKLLLEPHEAPRAAMKSRQRAAAARAHRGHRLQQLPSPTEQQLQQRESGWNDRFFCEPPVNASRGSRPERVAAGASASSSAAAANSPKASAAAQHKKEKKIRDERLQYGNSELKRKAKKESKQPASGRLAPLGVLPEAAAEAQLPHPSREEKLRLKALRAIESRENALYQLNALVLCTPIQEALFQPSRPADPAPPPPSSSSGFQRMRAKASMVLAPTRSGGAAGVMTNAREATKLAQKLAEDLQLAGIQCVEAIVEWMLEAGAKAEKPPPFLWRDRNYFLKMNCDLDFAQAELEARGVFLECYRRQNPLLIRASQKLGRVLAAQAIITEMVELASASSRPVHEPGDHGFEKRSDAAVDDHASEQPEDATADFDDPETRFVQSDSLIPTVSAALREESSADVMILQSTEDEKEEEDGDDEHNSGREEPGSDREQDGTYENDDDGGTSVVATPPRQDLDTSSAEELVHILDESLSDLASLVRQQHSQCPDGGRSELGRLPELSARQEELTAVSARTASEYDDGFDDDAGDSDDAGDDGGGASEENQDSHDTAVDTSSAHPLPPDSGEEPEKAPAAEALLLEHGASSPETQDGDFAAHESQDNQSSEIGSGEQSTSEPEPAVSDLVPENPVDPLLAEMSRLSREAGCEPTDIPTSLTECASWKNESQLVLSLERHEPLDAALEGSFYAALAAFELSPTLKQTEALLLMSVAKSTQLSRQLWRECVCITDSVYSHAANKIELTLESGNSLVSEIEIDEVLELTEGVLGEVDKPSWSHLRTAIEFLQLLRSLDMPGEQRDATDRRTSPGVNRLVKLFYPYLVNLPREKLAASWRRIVSVVAARSPHLGDLDFLMDPTCKTLLLAAVVGGSGRNVGESEDESVVAFPKLTIVCERGNVLETSAAAVWSKVFAAKSVQRFQFVLYPFFGSSFGEKIVDGVRVEEGEGRGPLKEWITLVSSEMTAKWAGVTVDASLAAENGAEANDNKLTATGLARLARAGYEISWQSPDAGQSVVRVVNKIVDDDSVLLDRGVGSRQSFPISELRVRRPRNCFLEHIKASESFWLNAQTADSLENRRVLRFYGWYLATAVAHYTSIDMPVHQLFFRLLLDESHRVSLEDVRSLDSTLYDSLVAMKCMTPSDFRAFLELEGADTSLSPEAYIERVVDEQFGAESNIGWQMRELRAGFHSVFSLDDLSAASIEPGDLAAVVCGSASSTASRDADFSVDEIFRVALDPDFVKCAPLRRVFWRVVSAFDPQLKRKFVKFVTGVDTLPLPGTEFMRLEMPFAALTAAENQKILQMLPQSHTCDNTLELPNYWRALCWKAKHAEDEESETLEQELAALLDKKLRDALEYSSGYGLDATSAVSGILSAHRRPMSSASRRVGSSRGLANDESYESLDLPAMGDLSDSVEAVAPAQQMSPKAGDAGVDAADEVTVGVADTKLVSSAAEEERRVERRPIPARSDLEADEDGDTVAEIAPSSPRKSARRNDATEESYGDDDFEEEVLS